MARAAGFWTRWGAMRLEHRLFGFEEKKSTKATIDSNARSGIIIKTSHAAPVRIAVVAIGGRSSSWATTAHRLAANGVAGCSADVRGKFGGTA
jgi:hypothetical protein